MIQENYIEVYIEEIIVETSSIKRFVLKAVDRGILPRFSPGSHIILYLATNQGMIERRYSLVSDPAQRESYEIAVKLTIDSKGGSSFLHHQAAEGDRLQISFPKNYFTISSLATHHVFYAAGIGITPFLSMMHTLKRGGHSFELHYAARSKEECAFYQYLVTNFDDHISFYFSNEQHRLTTLSLQDHLIGTHVYFCGPPAFISTFIKEATEIGFPSSHIHYEHFTPSISSEKGRAFTIKLNNGEHLKVKEEVSILDTLLAAGYYVPSSCKIGRCGTCEINVKAGSVLHLDDFLSLEEKRENKTMLTCVSRCSDNLLELDI